MKYMQKELNNQVGLRPRDYMGIFGALCSILFAAYLMLVPITSFAYSSSLPSGTWSFSAASVWNTGNSGSGVATIGRIISTDNSGSIGFNLTPSQLASDSSPSSPQYLFNYDPVFVTPTGSGACGISTQLLSPWGYSGILDGSHCNFWIDGILQPGSFNYNSSTHFISVSPVSSTTLAVATTTSVGADFYIGNNDLGTGGRLQILLTQNISSYCGSSVLGSFLCSGGFQASPIEIDLPSATSTFLVSGEYMKYATTTFPYGGQWTATYNLQVPYSNFYGLFTGYNTVLTTSSIFVIGGFSAADVALGSFSSSTSAQATSSRSNIGSALASSTLAVAQSCSPVSSNISTAFLNPSFNPADCLVALVVPGPSAFQGLFADFQIYPPLAYAFRVYNIFISSSSVPFALISTTIPSVLPGAGSKISLDLTGGLRTASVDLLDATSGPYLSSGATSTQTFYQITSFYWDLLIYVLTGIYVLSRILGVHIIPQGGFGDRGSLSDNGNEAYRLKEWLYKNKK